MNPRVYPATFVVVSCFRRMPLIFEGGCDVVQKNRCRHVRCDGHRGDRRGLVWGNGVSIESSDGSPRRSLATTRPGEPRPASSRGDRAELHDRQRHVADRFVTRAGEAAGSSRRDQRGRVDAERGPNGVSTQTDRVNPMTLAGLYATVRTAIQKPWMRSEQAAGMLRRRIRRRQHIAATFYEEIVRRRPLFLPQTTHTIHVEAADRAGDHERSSLSRPVDAMGEIHVRKNILLRRPGKISN